MACISRNPRCGSAEAEVAPMPLTTLLEILGIIGLIATIIGALSKLTVVNGVIMIGGTAIGSAVVGGVLVGAAAAIATVIIIAVYVLDRCVSGEGSDQCIAGVVIGVEESFSSAWDELFPFTAMHDRVDVVAKSFFWDVIESGEAFVFCTADPSPRTSEIMRCYFYDKQVCAAADGALAGGGIGAVAGVLAAAAIAAAIGCATIILCLIALLVAAIVAVAAVLIGALIGGQIAKAASSDSTPSAGTGETIAVGQLVTVKGNMKRREHDDGANVFWWTHSAQLHGNSTSPQPFSYCELDEELPEDGCFREVIIK